MEYWIIFGWRVVSGVVSERPFGSQLSGGDVAFKDVFGMGGDFQVNCLSSAVAVNFGIGVLLSSNNTMTL